MKKLNNMGQAMGARRGRLEKLAPLVDLKLGLRYAEAVFVLGSSQLFTEMLGASWIKPVINRHKLVLFDRGDIVRAWARILNGEEPPRLVRANGGRQDRVAKTNFRARRATRRGSA